MGDIGVPELLVILGVALLIFGPKKIGELGKGLGEGIRNFKSSLKGSPEPVQPSSASAEPAAVETASVPAQEQTAPK